ncbi:hypothetical protein Pcinc_016987 [Petrolisthes cinctipes]|uniref:Uncharacterized protein n=1 Tax=Petrolisthes cinctipes TaxID=88211 RepID=A0AAE1FV47_PETCI|nr:hypothetical protein Pcinc_016987 [Petrolisthes cinctipes]
MNSGLHTRRAPSGTDKRSRKNGPPLTAANNSKIRTYGARMIPLNFNSWHFKSTFTIADVSQPLLDADFLRANSLLVDVKGNHLVNSETFESLTLRHAGFIAPHLGSVTFSDNYAMILAEFPDIITPHFTTIDLKHGAKHHIPTTGSALQLAKDEFHQREEMGLVCRSNSPWASPLHMVAKRENEEIHTYHTAISGLVLEDVRFGPADTTIL